MNFKLLVSVVALSILPTMALGQAENAHSSNYQGTSARREPMSRVTGIGGIFIKAKDPAMLQDWYKQHLGIDV